MLFRVFPAPNLVAATLDRDVCQVAGGLCEVGPGLQEGGRKVGDSLVEPGELLLI